MADNPRLMKAKMSQSGIHVSLEWVTACLEWLAGEQPGLDSGQLLLKLKEQWLITDIATPGLMERAVLPENLAETVKIELSGQYCLQVQYGHDIGTPAYGQLQKLHKVDLENARVSADDSQASQAGQGGYQATQGGNYLQSWEPRPQRVMMLTLTDGYQTIEAMEHQVIKAIPDVIPPGVKVQVMGPVVVRRGIIMLCDRNFRVLGGEVEELQDQFNLVNVLQQKIGKDDVGQKGNMFANSTSNRIVPTARPPVTVSQDPRPIPEITPDPVTPSDMSDDDDDMLLLAASQIDYSEAETNIQASVSRPSSNQNNDSLMYTKSNHKKSTPVGVVQPLRTIEPSNTPQAPTSHSDSISKKMKAQSSITSFMVTKPDVISEGFSNTNSNALNSNKKMRSDPTPSFSLLDSDDEFLSDLPMPVPQPAVPVVADEPFQYLINLKSAIQSRPDAQLQAKFKVVSSTLASKMCLKKTASGPQWQVAIMLNDGSDSIKADMSPELLDREIGPAKEYVNLGAEQQSRKLQFKERMKQLSLKLAQLSCLVTIKVEGFDVNPSVIKIEEVGGLHTSLMRRRKLL